MAENNIETKTKALVSKIIQDLGYDLYDVEYLKEGKEYHLCIYIDKDGEISIADCEKVNDAINQVLDDADIIKEQYFLEISSAGLERKLRTKEHFIKQIGNKIEVKLFSKIDNENVYSGILKEYNDDYLILQLEDKEIKIEKNMISSAKTVYEW